MAEKMLTRNKKYLVGRYKNVIPVVKYIHDTLITVIEPPRGKTNNVVSEQV